ncbi:hypothetical protein SEA_NOSHOW_76 [Mycobacterium phage NoShow]|nr:hypothetical protein SEA_NOSHOW_76 [Mycobacterium phage NoShow]
MPYIFTPAAPDSPVARFADMKDFRAAFSPLVLTIKGSKVTLDGAAFGTLSYTKKGPERPADVSGAPTMVQPSDDRPSLDDVLASIDSLEAEDLSPAVDADDTDGLEHDDEEHTPVTFPVNSDEDIEDIVNWQLRNSGGQLPSTITVRPPTATAPARRRSTHARMSHKNCGHAITGEAGKIARAECRARHRAALAAAS